jgi:phosphomethylpyrimidine synthase
MTTQLQQANNGIITPEMEAVAQLERVDAATLRDEIAQGRIVLPKNVNHSFLPKAIGRGLSTKINANIGTSEKHCRVEEELEKLRTAIRYGADSVMDLSTAGDLHAILQRIICESSVMVGTVPITVWLLALWHR